MQRRRFALGFTSAALLFVLLTVASIATAASKASPTNAQRLPDGTISWLFKHEPRGQSLAQAHIPLGSTVGSHWQPVRFARVITPDLSSSERIVVSLIGKHGRNICMTVVEKEGTGGGGCAIGSLLRPLSEMSFSNGNGRQGEIVAGLASDDVARMALLLPGGHQIPVPLKDNAFVFTIKAPDFPSSLVAYDKNGLVISKTTQRPLPHVPR